MSSCGPPERRLSSTALSMRAIRPTIDPAGYFAHSPGVTLVALAARAKHAFE